MASITREQVNKLNSKCANGFHFDLQHFLFHNEKTFEKYINIGENTFLRANIMYYEKWDRSSMKPLNVPTIHLAEYRKGHTDGVLVSYGIGYFVSVSEPVSRKNTNLLAEITKNFDDEKLLSMYKEHKSKSTNVMA